ncbi:alpha-ketoglutarate-dependent dioxygenase AlkB [Marinicella rhabdoformis]|uniref:alpha-ketoglutarate-dependent dioxygenase AlkB n=1 Tax=Marinicella rhabdoformis TaxID=2580566 RepID=UPI0012AEDD9D|nr:alpha-ketoglutarate-dependent dioxygenase AlkB [Marinicella rhabdoformis]
MSTPSFDNDLFDTQAEISKDIYLFRNKVSWTSWADDFKKVVKQAPLRFMHTPGGKRLNISMTNCGDKGWTSGQAGYRYLPNDPKTGKAWPKIPQAFIELAQQTAIQTGFNNFKPNACLLNHYQASQKLSAHQDKNEPDLSKPVVSVSLGMSATFLIYGDSRNNPAKKITLNDGDVMIWGRTARLMYHGVETKNTQPHPELGFHRFNVTLRQV